jgi:hypothetical protein
VHQSTVAPPVTSTRSLSRAERIILTRAATSLKPAEKLLLRALVDFMGNSTECWPSLSRLAAEVGVSIRHVRRMLRSLEAAGWIVTRSRFRADRSQTSCVYAWCKVPDTYVRPPRTSTSALEKDIVTIQSNTYAAPAECEFCEPEKAPETQPEPTQKIVEVVSTAPAAQSSKPSPRFIVIDGEKFLDIKEAERVYHAAVAAKLLNSGTVDRLAFFACWCAVAAKLRAGRVRHPERMIRFLLDNRKAMSAYPDHAAELKAREAVRHLFPEKPYNPHG